MATTDQTQSAILKALADENRIRLLRLLSCEVLNVQEICEILSCPQPRVIRHLSILRGVGLVQDQREGSRVYYSLAPLEGPLDMISGYLQTISEQEHPDFERLDAVLRRRTSDSQAFAREKAGHWDQLGRELHSSTAALIALAQMASGERVVVDLGTGTGLLLPILANFAGKVYAVDHSEEMLSAARRRCEEQSISNVEFICSGIDELANALPEPCDCLFTHFVLHQLSSPEKTISAAAQCLKPHGQLVIVDRTKHDDEDARTRFGSIWLGFEKETISQWLERGGLSDVVYHELPADPNLASPSVFVASARKP